MGRLFCRNIPTKSQFVNFPHAFPNGSLRQIAVFVGLKLYFKGIKLFSQTGGVCGQGPDVDTSFTKPMWNPVPGCIKRGELW
jgi:hypothetical protein